MLQRDLIEARVKRETEIAKESPSRQIILALKERVLMPLEAMPADQTNRALQRAIDHLNDGLLWLMQNETANFMKGK